MRPGNVPPSEILLNEPVTNAKSATDHGELTHNKAAKWPV